MIRRRLLHFLALGAVLFVTRRALSEDVLTPAPLSVQVAPDASPAAVRAAVDEAMLLDVALRAGWARTDPVVVDRLVRNLRFAGSEGPDDALLDEAHRLDMPRRDPVARRRLIERARAWLVQRSTPKPSDDELETYRQQHAARFIRPGRAHVHQVFLSAERHGEALDGVAATTGRRLRDDRLTPADAAALSDPILLGTDLGWIDARRLDGSLGAGTAAALTDAATQRWIGPVRTAFGLCFFWIDARRPAVLPPLAAIRAEVEQAWRRDAEARATTRALERLRTTYEIEVTR